MLPAAMPEIESRTQWIFSTASFDETITGRRSIRSYQRREVPEPLVHEVLHLARLAPTSMNAQPCHFVVIRALETRRRLVEIKNRDCPPEKRAYPADFLLAAPVIVVVCVERPRSFGRELENGILASAFLLLAARSRGLGGVFLTAYQKTDPGLASEIRGLLGLPHDVEPVTVVPLGFPDPDSPPPPRTVRPLAEIVHHETFDSALRNDDRPAP